MSKHSTALLCEKLRAFVVLGQSCSLTETVKQLGITRQTVRRHVLALEDVRGSKLLNLVNRRYQLTAAGQGAHANALELLTLMDHWLNDQLPGAPGLSRTEQSSTLGEAFFAQQQPLTSLWQTGEPQLQAALTAWTKAQGWLESAAFDSLRPHLVVYRYHKEDWVCVSIGEESPYAKFVGPEFARSAIGLSVTDDPLHRYSAKAVTQAYSQTLTTGSLRYDHVVRRVPESLDHASKFLSYQRLLMTCRFPNGQPAIAILSQASDKVDISGLPPLERMKLAQISASVAPTSASSSIASTSHANARISRQVSRAGELTLAKNHHPLIYEILTSFVSLGRHLNLPESVAELGVTRQTIRRHIRALEAIKKTPLLNLEGQRYCLTKEGKHCLEESQQLLDGFSAWLRGDLSATGTASPLQHVSLQDRQGLDYRSQRHPLFQLWPDAPDLIHEGIKCWIAAAGMAETLNQLPLWDHLMIYRQLGDSWLIAAIGKQAPYRKWLDSTWVKSAVGRPLTDAPTSPEMTAFLIDTYNEALASGTPRLDHIYSKRRWNLGDQSQAVTYQRLLFPITYPDRSTALASLNVVTDHIQIDGLSTKALREAAVV